jgi:hypothetical protein
VSPRARLGWFFLAVAVSCTVTSCKKKPQHYQTTVEVMQVRQYGREAKITDLEVKFIECPGNARKVMRIDKSFSECGAKLKLGDKLKAEISVTYNAERGVYRDWIDKLGECAVKTDPKDEANYNMVENCKDLEFTGSVVGVRCERGRSKELVAKCPWMRRN